MLEEVIEKHQQGVEVHQLLDTFKSQLLNTKNTIIPNKEKRSRNNIHWIEHKDRKMKKNRGFKKKHKKGLLQVFLKEMQKNKTTLGKHSIFEGLNNHDTKPSGSILNQNAKNQKDNHH